MFTKTKYCIYSCVDCERVWNPWYSYRCVMYGAVINWFTLKVVVRWYVAINSRKLQLMY